MAENTTYSGMAQTQSDIAAMKETLRAQQQLLQKLYAELDQEREASATAASEALDMILRLQGEKAAVKMEASQYKRMAEEKIGHAEAMLEVFEELMCQKEMEIASFEFQVQAYKYKLVSLGCDLNASEFGFSEDLLSNSNDGENGQSSKVRRLHSLSPFAFKSTLTAAQKRETSPSPVPVPVPVQDPDLTPKIVEESTDQEVTPPSLDLTRKSVDFQYGTLDSYWNQIKKLDEKLKLISDCIESEGEKCTNLSTRGRSCSIFSQDSTIPFINSDKVNHAEGTQANKTVADPPSSLNVHDVFEVPQTSEKQKVSKHGEKVLKKWNSEARSRLTKPDSVSEGMVESHVKHDSDKLKSTLSAHLENKISSSKDAMTVICQKKGGNGVDCNAQAEFQKLHQRIARLERERISTRQEITQEGEGEEQLRLLKDIQNQLMVIQLEMRSWKTKKATPKDEVPLGPLQEAMLHFWL